MRSIFVAGMCVLAVSVVAFYFFYAKEQRPLAATDTAADVFAMATATTTPEMAVARAVPDGWREYRSGAYRFSLFYPQTLSLAEQSEGEGAATITFQDVAKGEGFQIFVVRYSGSKVSEARFKQDVPSGVRTGLRNTTVDDADGAVFYSKNVALGDTYEVWFTHGGFLYEVTTLKQLDSWLGHIMQTWKFLQ